MTIVVSSSKLEKVFDEKDVINIGTNPNCDFHLDVDFDAYYKQPVEVDARKAGESAEKQFEKNGKQIDNIFFDSM